MTYHELELQENQLKFFPFGSVKDSTLFPFFNMVGVSNGERIFESEVLCHILYLYF